MGATTAKVEEHEGVQEANGRLARLRRRKRELTEELRRARVGDERDVDELADSYESEGFPTTEVREVGEIQRELRVVQRAITTAKADRNAARNDAEEVVLEEIGPRYRHVQRRLARLARKFLAESETEERIRERAREAGLKPLASRDFHRPPVDKLREWLETAEKRFDL